jgi:amino acid transporter
MPPDAKPATRFLAAVAATGAFVLVLLLAYVVHVRFFRVDVVFYAAILDGVLAALVCGALLLAARRALPFSTLERALLFVNWLLLGYCFAISVPTVIDRSLSFYILEKLAQRGGAIREDRFEEVFTREYMREHHLVEVRLTEQQQSGTITIENGCVRLTPRGARLASFSRYFRKHLLPRERLLMGRYTDALTDPFRDSRTDVDYRCPR